MSEPLSLPLALGDTLLRIGICKAIRPGDGLEIRRNALRCTAPFSKRLLQLARKTAVPPCLLRAAVDIQNGTASTLGFLRSKPSIAPHRCLHDR